MRADPPFAHVEGKKVWKIQFKYLIWLAEFDMKIEHGVPWGVPEGVSPADVGKLDRKLGNEMRPRDITKWRADDYENGYAYEPG
jgi:hypothetical protein